MSAAGHDIAEKPVHHAFLHSQVDDGFFLSVIYAGELSLVGFLLDHLDLVHDLCRDILGSQLRIVQEKCLAVDCYLADSLAVGCHGAVCAHFHSGKFFEQVLKHVIVRGLERRGVVLYGVLLYHDRIAGCRYARSIQHLLVRIEFHNAQVYSVLHSDVLGKCLVTKQFGFECVSPGRHLLKCRLALVVRESVFTRRSCSRFGERYSGIAHRLTVS